MKLIRVRAVIRIVRQKQKIRAREDARGATKIAKREEIR